MFYLSYSYKIFTYMLLPIKKLFKNLKFNKILTVIITLSLFEEILYRSIPSEPINYVQYFELPVIGAFVIMAWGLFRQRTNSYAVPDNVFIKTTAKK